MYKVKVNGKLTELAAGKVLPSLRKAGVEVPAVCWHPDIINSGGRCRVCVCKIDGRVVTPCNVELKEGMNIDTESEDVLQLRKAAQALLPETVGVNPGGTVKQHPSLVGKTVPTDKDERAVYPKSRYIIRRPELCVHCNLCVEVCAQQQGVGAVADLRKDTGGEDDADVVPMNSEVGTWHSCGLPESECISCGQCINVCPTGALEEVTEIDSVEAAIADSSKTTVVQFAPAVRVALAEEFGLPPGSRSLTHEMVAATRKLGDKLVIFDTNFTADLTIIEEGYELLERLRRALTGTKKYGGDHMPTALPMITSCSPGWVLFCEKNYHDLLENLSTCKSPMQMAGALTKNYWGKKLGLKPEDIESVAVMPCVAKKAEKTREEFRTNGVPDVDHVLTTREFAKLLKSRNIDPTQLEGEEFDTPYGIATGAGLIFGATGGVMEAAIRTAYEVVTGREVPFRHLDITPVRGMDGVKEAAVKVEHVLPEWSFLEGAELKIAVCHGTSNARKLMDRVREAKERGLAPPYHFIEVMACPGGCLGGGGQPKPTSMEIKKMRASLIYAEDADLPMRKSHDNPAVKSLYENFLKEPLGHHSHELLHTSYTARDPESASLLANEEGKQLRQEVLYNYPKTRSRITNLVSEVVDKYGYVSDTAVVNIANHIGTTAVNLDSVLSHYHYFPRHETPKSMVYICECLNCRQKGALAVRDAMKAKGIRYHSASWLGWCVNGSPAALVKHVGDERVHQMLNLTPDDERLSNDYISTLDAPVSGVDFNVVSSRRFDPSAPSVIDNLVFPNKPEIIAGQCPASKQLFNMDPEALINEIKLSGLRGCGGAGFPTHFKWSSVRGQSNAVPKHVVINADEGLPNTFKDYYLLQDASCRMRMIVGASLAAVTVGSRHICMYLRYEYKNLKASIEASFAAYKKLNPALPDDLQFEVVLGAGPYVCGEETALFESVEGHAPQARSTRTIYPTVHGLFGQPTLVGNVETFTWIPAIGIQGGAHFASYGAAPQHSGIKLLSLSGDITPTLVEFKMGSTLQSVLEEVCSIPINDIAAVEIGGMMEPLITSGTDFQKPITLDGKGLAAGGSIVVYSKEKYDEVAIYQAKAKFGHIESCQLCAPCRDGTRALRKSMKALLGGQLHGSQRVQLQKLTEAMEISSNCGHGKACGAMGRVLMDRVYKDKKAD